MCTHLFYNVFLLYIDNIVVVNVMVRKKIGNISFLKKMANGPLLQILRIKINSKNFLKKKIQKIFLKKEENDWNII